MAGEDKKGEGEEVATATPAIYQQPTDIVPRFEISIEENRKRIKQVQQFVAEQMQEGEDFGKIPGIDKPSLLKAGAEKLCNIFGFAIEYEEVSKVEDWDKPLFAYTYRCIVRSKRTGIAEAESIGSCNSKEAKYAYRWMPAFKATEADKVRADKEEVRPAKSGQSYTWYRVPNEDIYTQVNTIQKMAQKRALVGAVLLATRASGFMTQDVEDFDTPTEPARPVATAPTARPYTPPATPAYPAYTGEPNFEPDKARVIDVGDDAPSEEDIAYQNMSDEERAKHVAEPPRAKNLAPDDREPWHKSTLGKVGATCESCGRGDVTPKVEAYSKEKFGKVLCFDCQKTPKR